MKNWMSMEKCFFSLWQLTRTRPQNSGNRSRNAAEGRCWTSVCAFSSEDSDAECRVTINDSVFCKEETSTAIGMIKEKKRLTCKTEKSQKIKSPRKSNPPHYLWGCFEGVFVPDLTRLGMREGVFVPDLTRSGVRVRGLGLVWTSGPTRSDRDQHQTRSWTRHRNLTRLVSYVLLTSLMPRTVRGLPQTLEPGPSSRFQPPRPFERLPLCLFRKVLVVRRLSRIFPSGVQWRGRELSNSAVIVCGRQACSGSQTLRFCSPCDGDVHAVRSGVPCMPLIFTTSGSLGKAKWDLCVFFSPLPRPFH